jgi:hypothetical protein
MATARALVILAFKLVWITAALVVCLPVNIFMAWITRNDVRASVRTFMAALIALVGAQPMVNRVRLWIRALRA